MLDQEIELLLETGERRRPELQEARQWNRRTREECHRYAELTAFDGADPHPVLIDADVRRSLINRWIDTKAE